jgi:hypothetical protein
MNKDIFDPVVWWAQWLGIWEEIFLKPLIEHYNETIKMMIGGASGK